MTAVAQILLPVDGNVHPKPHLNVSRVAHSCDSKEDEQRHEPATLLGKLSKNTKQCEAAALIACAPKVAGLYRGGHRLRSLQGQAIPQNQAIALLSLQPKENPLIHSLRIRA
jgi:hypothetical protein